MDLDICSIDSAGFSRSSLKKISFDCGNQELNEYLKKYALINDRNGVAKVFLAVPKNSQVILGYYTSSASVISTQTIPDELRGSFPKETPALLIGRIAVEQSMQGKGIGKRLLRHAFECAIDISQKTGVYAVRVDAKNEQIKEYYKRKFGFLEFQDAPLSLFIPLATIKKALDASKNKNAK
ncbi:GNAT family N-acetyltransferase [Chlorogloeopsis sp. ULAP02]|uniref:GNAT family N-acetyltransferase n=1 Tax=Chlorogloeopsis sp. ULAP02 TaxID=3107926 RepID=UPI003135A935